MQKKKIVITDFTRFRAESKYVCTAGLELETLSCIRPMPYLSKEYCMNFGIRPGSIIEGFFHDVRNDKPHMENHRYSGINKIGDSSEKLFSECLIKSSVKSLNEGFSTKVMPGEKHLTKESKPQRSLFTLKIDPDVLKLRRSKYDGVEKISADFNDGVNEFSSVAITDFYFYEAILKSENFERISNGISKSQDLFLRIGLSQPFKNPKDSREVFWIQINGIFAFPSIDQIERGYVKDSLTSHEFKQKVEINDDDLFC